MSSAFEKMLDQFREISELQAFARAQQKTIMDLTKKNKNLDEEVKHLKKLLEQTVPVIKPTEEKIDFGSNDEEAIAREQLFLLKKISNERELTLEETKRVEIFSKILNSLKEKQPKVLEIKAKQLSDAELLAQISQAKEDDSDGKDQQH